MCKTSKIVGSYLPAKFFGVTN